MYGNIKKPPCRQAGRFDMLVKSLRFMAVVIVFTARCGAYGLLIQAQSILPTTLL
jgi:hypothetical protein